MGQTPGVGETGKNLALDRLKSALSSMAENSELGSLGGKGDAAGLASLANINKEDSKANAADQDIVQASQFNFKGNGRIDHTC